MRKTMKAVHPDDFTFLAGALDQEPRTVKMDVCGVEVKYPLLELPGNICVMPDKMAPCGEVRIKLAVDLDGDHIKALQENACPIFT